MEAAVDLSIRYLPDFRLPDKAIDLIDQACARRMLATFSLPPSGASAAGMGTIDVDDVAAVVAERCKIPIERLTQDESRRLLEMEGRLGLPLDAQAISQIIDKILRRLIQSLSEKKIVIELTDEARDLLVARDYDPRFGARSLNRQSSNVSNSRWRP